MDTNQEISLEREVENMILQQTIGKKYSVFHVKIGLIPKTNFVTECDAEKYIQRTLRALKLCVVREEFSIIAIGCPRWQKRIDRMISTVVSMDKAFWELPNEKNTAGAKYWLKEEKKHEN